MRWRPGERVVLRYRLDDGLHDALGTVVEAAIDHVSIETRRGLVRVEATTMVTGKSVPSPRAPGPRAGARERGPGTGAQQRGPDTAPGTPP
ncbi:hypothetical protein [Pauljensenia hongkongensis]|uniref:Histone acetyltransferase Rv0428c-like SH3 domain-containing protein n=1 Tax=Pauljensenia hongkongensis TaxID=178339 RepID=A0A1D8B1M3_9ACTO|nr:hypothetical protein [Pauljensenia hongkongensis]AOS47012.1 hypothetical protein BH719_03350 [Pauljensenia hongkongensis]EFW10318.1 hypothetical protein HMPREF9005_0703 [Actinomyces sp. oral taxon 178 str. F0338]RKV66646.1 MAG: hypothetical protein D8B55_01095 [Actinomyces sp.]